MSDALIKTRKEGRIGAPTLASGGSVDAALATRAKAVTGSATAFPPAAPPSAEEADLDDDADYD